MRYDEREREQDDENKFEECRFFFFCSFVNYIFYCEYLLLLQNYAKGMP